MSHTIHHLM